MWTGWTREQFDEMERHLVGCRRSNNRSVRSSLAMFWMKLKTDLSFEQIASLFNLDLEHGRKYVGEAIHSVAKDLETYFVPLHLGVGHLSREEAMAHNTTFSSTLYGANKVMTVWDGTYYYIERSGDHELARRTYSGHKNRPLVKFMSIVFPDGYVLEAIGPYLSDGKNNDAGITKHIIHTHQELIDWMEDEDVAILDRGFRDCIDQMKELGLECKMPSYLQKGVPQHTIEEANDSRLITKLRWVVESYHGRVKKWTFFDNRIHMQHLSSIGVFVRIVTAAINAFRPLIKTDKPEDLEYAQAMLSKAAIKTNHVFERVEKGALSSRGGHWIVMDSSDAAPTFPILTKEDLYGITLGSYQLKQASHYTNEHLDENGDYLVEIHMDAPDLLRARIQSRHVGSKRYFLWIEYDPDDDEPIKGWYCQCKPGQRVVGCCAHVASVLWYLGVARHEGYQPRKRIKVLLNAATASSS